MNARVVDTNVAIVANRRADQAGPACVLACVHALERIVEEEMIVLDSIGLILAEYAKNLSYSGQPGVGDAFFKWVWSNQANQDRCERAVINSRENSDWNFVEFPTDPRLEAFDRSDRKFAAVALTSKNNPTVLNAVDSDWWIHREALTENGVRIDFVCPEQFQ